MSRNVFWGEVVKGDILYLSEPQAYRENDEKNHAYAPMLPDFVVVDDVFVGENGWQIDLVGFPYKKGAILLELEDHNFFAHVGNIEDHGDFDIEDIRENPYVFSNYYKVGGHLRSDNKTVLYLDGILSGMHNFSIEKPGNSAELYRLFGKYDRQNGKLLPSEMAYIINRLIMGLHKTFLVHYDGDVEQAMTTVIDILKAKSREMDTLPK